MQGYLIIHSRVNVTGIKDNYTLIFLRLNLIIEYKNILALLKRRYVVHTLVH